MIAKEQYALLKKAQNKPLNVKDISSGAYDAIKEYLYISEYYEVNTTMGFTRKPHYWSVAVNGLDEILVYEKNHNRLHKTIADKNSDKPSDDTSNKIRKRDKGKSVLFHELVLPLAIAVISGIIVAVIIAHL